MWAFLLPCRIQHIFDEDPVAHGWVVDEDMGDGNYEFAVLDDGRAWQEWWIVCALIFEQFDLLHIVAN